MDEGYSKERGLTPLRSHAELPLPTLRQPGRITPAPFDIDVEVRSFTAKNITGRLILIAGSASNKVRVTPGTVNQEMPTLGGDPLDDDPAPEITITGDTWVFMKCVGTFGSSGTSTITIETSSTSASPGGEVITSTGFTSYRIIGNVTVDGGNIDTIVSRKGGDLEATSFGNLNLWSLV